MNTCFSSDATAPSVYLTCQSPACVQLSSNYMAAVLFILQGSVPPDCCTDICLILKVWELSLRLHRILELSTFLKCWIQTKKGKSHQAGSVLLNIYYHLNLLYSIPKDVESVIMATSALLILRTGILPLQYLQGMMMSAWQGVSHRK